VSTDTTRADAESFQGGLTLPDSLRRQLADFRTRLRTIKVIEAVCGALCGIFVAWLVLFLLDRITDTPTAARWGLFLAAVAACTVVPLAFHRWIWGTRGLDRLARLIAHRFPSLGDQLLGIVELVRSQGEQQRSRGLCEAAIAQVAEVAARHDLRSAVPRPRHRLWMALAAAPLLLAGALALITPAAAANAWQRFLEPWRFMERFTFARIGRLSSTLVIPHGEATDVVVNLDTDSAWRPARATARVGAAPPLAALRDGDRYTLQVPPQVGEVRLRLAVGDARQEVTLQPTFRPEISGLEARVRLPEYLGIAAPVKKGLRGGGLSVVKGSRVEVTATANRELAAATLDGRGLDPNGSTIAVPEVLVEAPIDLTLSWQDRLGLSGSQPLTVSLMVRDDEPPTITVDGLGGKGVLLDSETIRFGIQARDDFGVKQVGLEWIGSGDGRGEGAAGDRGETVLATGGPEADNLDAAGTFSPLALGIAPQTVEVRAYVEDFLPGRERIRSAPTTFMVMNASDHALWITDQIARWRQQAAEVRDREMELLARNEQLLTLSPEALDTPEERKALREQAAAERSNGRRLERLAGSGAEIVRQAMRNPDFEAATLEELAEHVKTLEEMAAARMPAVSELLQAAAKASKGDASPLPPAPQVADREGSAASPDDDKRGSASQGGAGGPGRLGLPTTTVGSFPGGEAAAGKAAQQPLLAAAVEQQRKLIDDFAAIARQLADVMARLEGTTFVKRLKAAARSESQIGVGLATVVAGTFGRQSPADSDARIGAKVEAAARGNDEIGRRLSTIMDDLDAYFERRPMPAIRTVLEEMKGLDVLGSLRQLSDELPKETGLSIARSEFWSDTFDRWADELVPPPQSGGGGRSGPPRESLPPEVVLEAMQILEAETNLREETRVAEQVRAGIAASAFVDRAGRLTDTQHSLARRVRALAERLADMPDGAVRYDQEVERLRGEIVPSRGDAQRFAREVRLFRVVEQVMAEASGILARPDTGRRAIAAETEAIELLLQSQFGGGGGGGGGSSPGGGSGGTTRDSALARLGEGINARARPEAPEEEQAIGRSGRVLPEEFRDGLDAYFNALERGRDARRNSP